MSKQDEDQVTLERKRWLTLNRLRWVSRLCVLVACCLVFYYGRDTVWPVVVLALSPFVAIASVLATRTFLWFHSIGIVMLVIVAWRQRWFCRWVCPTGFCADKATWCGRRCGRSRGHWPAIGQWIALLTLVGAALGYPLLLWLDPLALLGACAGVIDPDALRATWWYVSGFAALLLVSLVWPNLWCAKLCPLGGLQDVAHGIVKLARTAGQYSRKTHPVGSELRWGIRRRTVLGAIFGLVWASATLKSRGSAPGPMRPPGAVDETRFTGLCIRCGNCARACPTDIIIPELGKYGVAGVLTPQIEFRDDYCLETCNQCTLVCPSGALQPVKLEAKIKTTIGLPSVDMDICLLGDDRECSICRNRCPYEAIRLEFSEEFYTLTPIVNVHRCPGCGACEVACPTQPTKAIEVGAAR